MADQEEKSKAPVIVFIIQILLIAIAIYLLYPLYHPNNPPWWQFILAFIFAPIYVIVSLAMIIGQGKPLLLKQAMNSFT